MLRLPASGAAALIALLFLACGGDDGGDTGDTGDTSDAGGLPDGAVSADNALGQTCSEANPCPDDPPHHCVFLTVGNPDVGYCSPVCATDQDCVDGYSGPATGQISCFVPGQPDACTIVCESNADCPGELACVATGGPVSVCTTE